MFACSIADKCCVSTLMFYERKHRVFGEKNLCKCVCCSFLYNFFFFSVISGFQLHIEHLFKWLLMQIPGHNFFDSLDHLCKLHRHHQHQRMPLERAQQTCSVAHGQDSRQWCFNGNNARKKIKSNMNGNTNALNGDSGTRSHICNFVTAIDRCSRTNDSNKWVWKKHTINRRNDCLAIVELY